VRSADSHGVFDLATLQAMNPEADILVGPHVWLGNGSSLLKGIEIGMGTIVGAGAIVTADLGPYSLCVGTPARVLRRGVSWTRNAVATEAEKQQILAAFERWGGVPPAA
jgi:acetyltransferase-like isoleucine patch superfamily enzyme